MENSFNFDLLKNLKNVFKTYKNREQKKCIFDSISDFYYRENYHSDILAYYFDYELARKKLIQWINKVFESRKTEEDFIPVHYENYRSALIIREEGRRDITIYNETKTNAIIIENKSNDAEDMQRQLIRYVIDLEEKNVTVDAIIYLNKTFIKEPAFSSDWTDEEIAKIKQLTISTRLVGSGSITENVINPILQESQDLRLSALSLEIKSLFSNIVNGGNKMNDSEFKELTQYLGKENNFADLKKVISAYNELPQKMRDYYFQYMQDLKTNNEITQKGNIKIWSSNFVYIDRLFINNVNYGVDFVFHNEGLEISLIIRSPQDMEVEYEMLREKMGADWIFDNTREPGERYYRTNKVNVFNEDEVKTEIKTVIKSFEKYLDA